MNLTQKDLQIIKDALEVYISSPALVNIDLYGFNGIHQEVKAVENKIKYLYSLELWKNK